MSELVGRAWIRNKFKLQSERKIVAKKLKTTVKLQIEAGKANPAPPIGPALAPHGINLMAFCKEYNSRTSSKTGEIIPAEISIYTDGSYTFILDLSFSKAIVSSSSPKPSYVSRDTFSASTRATLRSSGKD